MQNLKFAKNNCRCSYVAFAIFGWCHNMVGMKRVRIFNSNGLPDQTSCWTTGISICCVRISAAIAGNDTWQTNGLLFGVCWSWSSVWRGGGGGYLQRTDFANLSPRLWGWWFTAAAISVSWVVWMFDGVLPHRCGWTCKLVVAARNSLFRVVWRLGHSLDWFVELFFFGGGGGEFRRRWQSHNTCGSYTNITTTLANVCFCFCVLQFICHFAR